MRLSSRREPVASAGGGPAARPRALSALGLLLAAVLVVAVVAWPALRDEPEPAPVGSATGAAAFRGGPGRGGDLPDLGPVDGARLRWRYPTDGSWRANAPAIAGETVYVANSDGSVAALSLWTGEIKWRVESDNYLAAPAVAGDLVVVGGRDVAALDVETGQERWSFDAAGAVYGSPAVVDGMVFAGSTGPIEESPPLGRVFALDAADGDLLWEATLPGEVRASPAFAAGIVYVHAEGGGLHALDAATGEERWRVAVGSYWDIGGVPIVVDGTVYHVGREGAAGGDVSETLPVLRAFDAATGELRWSVGFDEHFGILHGPSPAIAGGVAYLGGGEFLYALDAATGRERWRTRAGYDTGDPTVAGNVVYVTASIFEDVYGAVIAFDAATGEELWRFGTPDLLPASPVVVDGLVVVSGYNFDSEDGTVYALWGRTAADLEALASPAASPPPATPEGRATPAVAPTEVAT